MKSSSLRVELLLQFKTPPSPFSQPLPLERTRLRRVADQTTVGGGSRVTATVQVSVVTPSSAVTFTVNVFSPSASATWKPPLLALASAITVLVAARMAWVALTSFVSGAIVISSTALDTVAV